MKNPKSATEEKDMIDAESAIVSKKVVKMIEEKGTYKVAKEMNVPQAKFQHLKNGGGLNLNTIIGLSKVIKIDWNEMIYGENAEGLMKSPEVVSDSELQKQLLELKERVKELEPLKERLIKAQGQIEILKEMAGMPIIKRKEDEMSATGTDSFTLVDEEARRETKVIEVSVDNGLWSYEGQEQQEREFLGFKYGKQSASSTKAI